jgi:MarR family transcriptional regulator, organic hydroperoxide resistance regulator
MVSIQQTTGFHLARACRIRRNLIAMIVEPCGLYVGQDLIMVQLWNEEGLTQTQLAERVGIDVSTMTRALQRLERNRFVERHQDTADTRVWHVCLTERGRALEPIVTARWNQAEQRTFAGFSADEHALLCGFLERIEQNLA